MAAPSTCAADTLRRRGWGSHLRQVEKLIPGTPSVPVMVSAVRDARFRLVFLSAQYLRSVNCGHECAESAAALPSRVRDVPLPRMLAERDATHFTTGWRRCGPSPAAPCSWCTRTRSVQMASLWRRQQESREEADDLLSEGSPGDAVAAH